MKRTFALLIAALLLLPLTAMAQDVTRSADFTAVRADDAVLTLRGTGVYNHRLTWTGAGTRTTCTIKVQQSVDAVTWTDLIAAQSCTTDGTATAAGYANYARINVTALSGTGNTVWAQYKGTAIAAATGTVIVSSSALPTGAASETTLSALNAKLVSGTDIGDVTVNSMPTNTTVTGTIDADKETVDITLPNGAGTVGLQITGTWVGQIEFEGSVDGTNYGSIEASNGSATINATQGNDIFILPGAGYAKIRVRASAWTSGSASVALVGSIGTAASILTGALPAGSNLIGKVNIAAAATGGCTPYSFISTASANLTSVTAAPSTLCSLTVINPGATLQYVRLYNKASAPDPSNCSANSDCAVIYIPIPAASDSLGAGVTIPLPPAGWAFSLGIGFSISGAACTVQTTCVDETSALAGTTIILGYK